MPYIAPNADACNFNFTLEQAGYTAPEPHAVNFNFTEISAATPALVLDAQWAIAGGVDLRSDLGARWSVEGFASAARDSLLQGVFAVAAGGEGFAALDARWAVDAISMRVSRLEARFALDAYALISSVLNARWFTDTLYFRNSRLNAQWRVPEVVSVSRLSAPFRVLAPRDNIMSALGDRWATDAQPNGLSILNARWHVEAPPFTVSALNSTWGTEGGTEVAHILESTWATEIPMLAVSILGATWKDLLEVGQELVIRYGDEILGSIEIRCDYLAPVAQGVGIDAALLDTVAQSLVIPSPMGDVVQALGIDAAMLGTVAKAIELPSPLLQTVVQSVGIDSPIKATTTVERFLEIPSPILGDALVVEHGQQVLMIDGVAVPLESLDIACDEGNYAWTCQAVLLDPAHFGIFAFDREFSIDLAGEVYTFVVEAKRMQRTGVASVAASITGISPSARYARPRARLVTKTWEGAVLASAVAAELVDAIDWRVIDWSIPARRLSADSEAPIEIVARIAAAAGAVVESNLDGTLYVRYAFPVPVADYASGAPDQSYSDIVDRFSVGEGFAAGEIVNRLRVLDVLPGAYADVIEWVPDRLNPATGRLRVYPSPWRETFELSHTSLPLVSIERLGVATEDHVETVEVLRGEGSVQYPLHQVLGLEWLYVNLGGIAFEPDQREFRSTVAGESLARITYRTRFVDYRAVGVFGTDVQFVVREPDLV